MCGITVLQYYLFCYLFGHFILIIMEIGLQLFFHKLIHQNYG